MSDAMACGCCRERGVNRAWYGKVTSSSDLMICLCGHTLRAHETPTQQGETADVGQGVKFDRCDACSLVRPTGPLAKHCCTECATCCTATHCEHPACVGVSAAMEASLTQQGERATTGGDAMKTGYLNYVWFALPNDIIGGWCVMPVNEPPSLGVAEVGGFLSQELAEHIAALHNRWLEERIDEAHMQQGETP